MDVEIEGEREGGEDGVERVEGEIGVVGVGEERV